jgi:sugar/nucleoside kinase (ribokinase family)
VDVVFANEAEICSLWEVPSFDEAVDRVRGQDRIWALTRSEKGSVVVNGAATVEVPAEPIDELIDTTGAGDLYAAGFLVGLIRGRELATCARLGSIAAAEIISHVGARPVTPLRDLVSDLV